MQTISVELVIYRMFRALFFFGSALMLTGCATKMKMCPVELQGQATLYRNGVESILSDQENTSVVFAPISETFNSSQRPSFVFSIANKGTENIEFSEEDIAMNVEGFDVHVFTYDELLKEERKRQTLEAIALALSVASGAIATFDAGRQTTHGTYSGYGNKGFEHGTFTSTTYNPSQKWATLAAANARNTLMINQAKNRHHATMDELAANYLKRNTILPGDEIGGRVEISCLKPPDDISTMMVCLDIGPDHHEFALEYDKIKD